MKGLVKFDPGYSHRSDRDKFAIKVYCVIFCQYLTMIIGVASVRFDDRLKIFLSRGNLWTYMFIIALVLILLLSFGIFCFKKCVRQPPVNYICLFLLTCANTIVVTCISTIKNSELVFLYLSMTLSMVFGIIMVSSIIKGHMNCIYGIFVSLVMGTFPVLYFHILNHNH